MIIERLEMYNSVWDIVDGTTSDKTFNIFRSGCCKPESFIKHHGAKSTITVLLR